MRQLVWWRLMSAFVLMSRIWGMSSHMVFGLQTAPCAVAFAAGCAFRILELLEITALADAIQRKDTAFWHERTWCSREAPAWSRRSCVRGAITALLSCECR